MDSGSIVVEKRLGFHRRRKTSRARKASSLVVINDCKQVALLRRLR